MPSRPVTPEGSPTHSTYEINVPVRDARSSPSSESSGSSPSRPPSRPPNAEIRIPKITPLASAPSPAALAKGLEGKYVDEFGNILDWDGTVLGRVSGDLPSMVGRPVTATGEILDMDDQVVGHVCEDYSKPDLKPLAGGLQVDSEGKIYDDQGNVVGKLNVPKSGDSDNGEEKGEDKQKDTETSKPSQSAPKPASAPRPDEMYLDVKSTYDGIQLIIKIPTVFNQGHSNNR
ncbi:hypothetical protein G7Z17_g4005 [Cylindrodendrum hubeiense]|uniref:Uncharacterized protein n=1 Tax=Cylindrodendrum hubeiense TaxID=595255 RepID=A0A9P5HK16_9HYPO|nr:hypothetical protein G7Z17_g4005 [Cylindrodendrum hubeiense]